MPKRYSSKHILKVLFKKGFVFVSQRGSHIKLTKKTGKRNLYVIVPDKKKVVPAGTFRSIVRQSDLTVRDFEK